MMHVNLLPEGYSQRLEAKRTPTMHLFVVGVVCLVIGIAETSRSIRQTKLNSELATINVSYNDANQQIQQLDSLRRELTQLQRQATLGVSLTSPVSRSRLLGEVANAIYPGIQLRSVTIAPRQSAAEVAPQRPRPGRAPRHGSQANSPADVADELASFLEASTRPIDTVLEGEAESIAKAHELVARLDAGPFSHVVLDMIETKQNRFVFRIVATVQFDRENNNDDKDADGEVK